MRKLKRKLAAIGIGLAVMVASVVPMSASAYVYYDNWGPRTHTPHTGRFSASTTCVYANLLKWNQASVDAFNSDWQLSNYNTFYDIEFEFRPVQPNNTATNVDPKLIWKRSPTPTLSSNLPNASYEFQANDPNDIAIVTERPWAIVAEQVYYGYLYLTPVSSTPPTNRYIFSSEYGYVPVVAAFLGDYKPLIDEEYNWSATYFGNTYSW